MRLELKDLSDLGADLAVIGFSAAELEATFAPPPTRGLTDEDDVPQAQKDVVTLPDDVWCLGEHKIICGDSTDAGVVKRLLGSAIPHLMVTDPPYGVNYDPTWRHRLGVASGFAKAN